MATSLIQLLLFEDVSFERRIKCVLNINENTCAK